MTKSGKRSASDDGRSLTPWIVAAFSLLIGTGVSIVLVLSNIDNAIYSPGERILTGLGIVIILNLARVSIQSDVWMQKVHYLDKIDELSGKIDELPGSVALYTNFIQFYNAISAEIPKADDSIRVIYMRRHPPEAYDLADPAAKLYFDRLLKWSEVGGRSLERIICKPDSKEMRSWVEKQDVLTKKYDNYSVGIYAIESNAVGAALNIAILDELVVFVGFAMPKKNEMEGLSIRNPKAVKTFIDYFERISKDAMPLQEYLSAPVESQRVVYEMVRA